MQNPFAFILVVAATVFSVSANANEPAKVHAYCDRFLNMAMGFMDEGVVVNEGSLKVDSKDKEHYISSDFGGPVQKATVMMDMLIGDNIKPARTNVTLENDGKVIRVARRMAAPDAMRVGDLIGFESAYDVVDTPIGKGCVPDQNLAVFKGSKEDVKRVLFDMKYCKNVRDILSKKGRPTASVCGAMIGDIQEAYNRRSAELEKEKKLMSDSLGAFADPMLTSVEEPAANMMLSLMSVCKPSEWVDFTVEMVGHIKRGQSPTRPKPTTQ